MSQTPTPSSTPALKQFPCKQCGAKLDYAPGTANLKCPYCGVENLIPQSEEHIEELDYAAALSELASQSDSHEPLVVRCAGCGATTTLDADIDAAACPFCGQSIVATRQAHTLIKPEALLPFKITRDQARIAFRQWIGSRWFAPGELKTTALADSNLTGLYVPYWTYDSDTTSFYRGERGDDYWVTESYQELENGKWVTKTRQVRKTRWTSVSGTVWNKFDDILVLASRTLPRAKAEALEPWDLPDLVPYSDEYLAGFRAQCYQVSLPEGFEIAKEVMAGTIHQSIVADIGGDHQRVDSVKTRYDHVTFKHLLLPVWMSAYRYRDKVFQFLINARTGEVQGERPFSALKVVLLVLAILAAVGVVALVAMAIAAGQR